MSKTFVLRVQERLNQYGAGLKADGLAVISAIGDGVAYSLAGPSEAA